MTATYHRPEARRTSPLSTTFLTLSLLTPAMAMASEGEAATTPSADTTPAVAASEAAPAKSPSKAEDDSLIPSWEKEELSAREVSTATIRFNPGKGLELKSADGAFSITTKVRGQILYSLDGERGQTPEPMQLSESMQIRRARVAFSGNLFGKHNKYKLELAISPRDMSTKNGAVGVSPVLDWNMTFDHLAYATVVAGQYKVPYNRERVISSGSQQFVDRSIVQAEFNLDRDIGFDIRSKELIGGAFRYYAGAYIGEGRGAFELGRPGHMFLGRVEFLPFGKFSDYEEADFERSLKPRLSVGAAYGYIENAKRNAGILGKTPKDGGTTDFHNVEGDFIFKMAGLSVQGEAFWRQGTRRPGSATDENGEVIPAEQPRNGYGFFTQAGYLLPKTALEVGARYGQIRPLGQESTLSERNELGAVVGYYFAHHSLKIQADYFRLWGKDGIGLGDNQVRLQMEAGF